MSANRFRFRAAKEILKAKKDDDGYFAVFDHIGWYMKDCCPCHFMKNTPNEALLQSTGLLDCKGVEAFIGDIYQQKDGTRWVICECDLLGFHVELVKNRTQWARDVAPGCFKGYCEIIGNIYENPELMEATT